ncbi:MAG: glycosyl transferase [Bdellovibrionales bacterium GWA2_49_15]|nr:MAG: glycosyl transferase [Bdellovibrionales bacterium GWA2_49_15]
MIKISGVIIAFNEEKHIERCINTLKSLCDEVIVVDSFSTDKTPEICRSLGVQFYTHAFTGHIEQKNYAMSLAKHDYVLSLDADEALSDELQRSIAECKSATPHSAYSFNRLTNYCGHWVRHCDWYPDVKVRLWRKDLGHWGGINPHDIVELKAGATTRHLAGDLLHYSYDTISSHVTQTNKFTTIAAQALFKQNRQSSLLKIYTRPPLKFLKDYFLRLGFLDGHYGFIICFINALSALLKYSKLYELQRNREI